MNPMHCFVVCSLVSSAMLADGELLVSSFGSDTIARVDPQSGRVLDSFGPRSGVVARSAPASDPTDCSTLPAKATTASAVSIRAPARLSTSS
ncbi:MAG: hypothetical protein SGJ11_14915 [Phycisphaerae bacterium]|nr:hypothetical protein [Phycisphaerae bacterium]